MAIIQARLTSTRFPKKILERIGDKTILEMVIERVGKAQLIDEVIIAAPHEVPTYGKPLFIGSEDDVLDRYYKCAERFRGDIIVRITSDCPLINPIVIDWAIRAREDWGLPYVCFAPIDGWDVQVFTIQMLKEAWLYGKDSDREHIGQYMARKTKVSVDTKEDLERIKVLWNGKTKPYFW